MNRSRFARLPARLALAAAALAAASGLALALTGGPYNLTWNTVDGGGAPFRTGGSYALGGTAGQADAGAHTGGDYALQGGFWVNGTVWHSAYAPVVRRP
jgi:hypothetical protein